MPKPQIQQGAPAPGLNWTTAHGASACCWTPFSANILTVTMYCTARQGLLDKTCIVLTAVDQDCGNTNSYWEIKGNVCQCKAGYLQSGSYSPGVYYTPTCECGCQWHIVVQAIKQPCPSTEHVLPNCCHPCTSAAQSKQTGFYSP
jgi:hypothetical protein